MDTINFDIITHGSSAQMKDLIARIDTHKGYPKGRTQTWNKEPYSFHV